MYRKSNSAIFFKLLSLHIVRSFNRERRKKEKKQKRKKFVTAICLNQSKWYIVESTKSNINYEDEQYLNSMNCYEIYIKPHFLIAWQQKV